MKKKKMGTSPIEQLLAKEFEKGKKNARDPQNAILPAGALRVTNHNSEWLGRFCMHCSFTFREEDHVRLCPNCDFPLHQDGRYGLRCWSSYFLENDTCPKCRQPVDRATLPDDEVQQHDEFAATVVRQNVYQQFTEGIMGEWTVFGEAAGGVEPRVVLDTADIAYGKKCLICNGEIRLGDRYVESPCRCDSYFHADVLRHLNCWSYRFTMKYNDYCIKSGATCKVLLAQPVTMP